LKKRILPSRNYYVFRSISESFNAGSKAKIDCEIVFKNLSLVPIQIFALKKGSKKKIERYVRRIKRLIELLLFTIRGLLTNEYLHSNVVYQTVDPTSDLLFALALRVLFRHGKRIIVVHDLESLRTRKLSHFFKEKITLRCFTHAILHSREMESFVREKMNFKGKTFILGFFDYLVSTDKIRHCDEEKFTFPQNGRFVIVYAGNLSKEKSGFLYKLLQRKDPPSNYQLVLFGKGYDPGIQASFVEYAGAFPPDDLPKYIKGHFGLVWDGDEVNGIGGRTGEYLRYNSPHKASLYVVSGLPIISWSGAAIYKYIEEYDIGFGVESLEELDERLKTISEDDYKRWKKNILDLSRRLSKGENLASILREIMDI